MNKERPEVLQRISEFEAKLAALGVTPDKISEVSALLGERSDLQADLEHYRGVQFYDDANDLYYKLSGRGQSKIATCSIFLREFAEHVAGFVLGGDQWVPQDDGGRAVMDLIDHVPAMHVDEQ